MQYLLDLLSSYGPLIVLAVAFLEALGFPLPAFPFLVLSGCLIAERTLSWPLIILGAMAGTIAGDMLWFWLGKRFGSRALDLLCRLSINPDACVDRSEKLFHMGSTATILTAKLVPGLNTIVPSLAGIMRMTLRRYATLDAAGSLLWAGAGVGLGMAFGRGVLVHLASVQHSLLLLLIGMIGFYIAFRVIYHIYLVKRYSVPRIEADHLYKKLASGEGAAVVDLRNNSAYTNSLQVLPGAIRIPPAEFERKVESLPREKDIVFYCT
jgi:membrane protein DedA with SNARE-associated domain